MRSFKKQTGYYESFDGTSIYYEVRGEGPPIIFCYGIGCLFNHWTHQLQHFSESYQTIVFDYRGHHKTASPEVSSNLSIEALARDLVGLMEHLKISSAPVVAHSFGSQVLLSAIAQHPGVVEKVIFINGLYRNPFELTIKSAELLKILAKVRVAYEKSPKVISKLWEKAVQNPAIVPMSSLFGGFNIQKTTLKDIEIYAKGIAGIDVLVFLTLFEDMVRLDQGHVLKTIKVPGLILCGSKDSLTPVEDQKVFEKEIQDSELHIIPYGSHCVQLDFPDMVNLKIQQFLESKK